jgi:hypothetical protein
MATTVDLAGTCPSIVAEPVVRQDRELSLEERSLFSSPALENFAHYARFSTASTRVGFVKVYRGQALCGLVPLMKLVKRKCTDLLRPAARKWLEPVLGSLSRKTIYMVDTALLGYDYACPFYTVASGDLEFVRAAACAYLKSRPDAQIVWIAEPLADRPRPATDGFDTFSILPTVQVDLTGITSVEAYLERLSRKRRRNYQHDQELFRHNGGTIEFHQGPLEPSLAETLLHCLKCSEARSQFTVPYADVLNNETAFGEQNQHSLVAKVGSRVVGFFSFFRNGDILQQCHGGLDYDLSLKVKAYHNLINAAIEYAIEQGMKRVSMGPMNNETKRRAGTHLLPCIASIWCRKAFDRLITRWLFIKNFQVYTGPVDTKRGNAVVAGLQTIADQDAKAD